MFTRNSNRRIVSGLAGALWLASLAAPSLGQIAVMDFGLVHPVEADICSIHDLATLLTDAGQPGVAGTGRVVGITSDGLEFFLYAPTSGPGALKDASAAEWLGNGEVAIADTGNHRVLIVNQAGQITWNSANVTFSDGRLIRGPVDVQIIPDSTPSMADNPILIACRDNNRVAVVRRTGQVLWAMNAGLSAPLKAERLANGNTLIADTGNNRVIEVNAQRQIVQSLTPTQMPAPVNITDAERLPDGSTLVLDSANGVLSLYGPNGSFVSNIGSSGQDGLLGATDVDINDLTLFITTPAGLWLNPQTY